MEEGAGATLGGIVGREPELRVLRDWVDGGGRSRAITVVGEAGIGKTTLWLAAVELARERRLRVLKARPSGAEARLSFAALIDLFERVDAGVLMDLPDPQRSALEVALLRAEPGETAPDSHAIALGFLNGLRALAAKERVVIAVDDLQWIDSASGDAIAFAVRRLEDEPVTFVLARRPGRDSALERALTRRGLERLHVGPLTFSATRRLLADRLGLVLPRQLLRRIVRETLGNPLFVLEVGRVLAERGLPATGEEVPVPDAVEEMLGTRVARLPPALRRTLIAVALSDDLRLHELTEIVGDAAVDEAIDAGLLVLDGMRVRASHPLLAAAARKRSPRRDRRDLHRALADAVADRELRALHLALATERPDPELAATVEAAARDASARGARAEAVVLAEHALRLTDPRSGARAERVLTLAGYLEAAGENWRLTDLLVPEVESLPAGRPQARAWLMLADGMHVTTVEQHLETLDRALAHTAGEPDLHAQAVAAKMADAASGVIAGLADAERWGLDALPEARAAGPEVERVVLCALAWASAMRGHPIDEVCERFLAASDAAFYIAESPVRIAAQRLVWRGELSQARAEIERLMALADEQAEPASYALVRLHAVELDLRAGRWNAATERLDEWAESSEAELLTYPMYERCRALAAAGEGLPDDVEVWSGRAVSASEALGVRWDWLEALRARGMAALMEQDPARAAANLRPVWEHTCHEGVDEPGVFPVAPEFVEALAGLGERDEALRVTLRLKRLSERQRHPWGLASARRCDAMVRLATSGYDEEAALALAVAAQDYARLGLLFDHARSLLSLGRAQRRMKQWGPARDSLQSAMAAFEELGSTGWAHRARSELERVGGRRPMPTGRLTATEREVVELAANGLANKEIAQALSLAVHTVEVHLSRAYAKLGVRSRSQLSARLPRSA